MNYTCYRNGPFYGFWRFILELLKFWNWCKMKKSWIVWSFKQMLPRRFEYPKKEFDFFMGKFKNRIEWFKEYGYKK